MVSMGGVTIKDSTYDEQKRQQDEQRRQKQGKAVSGQYQPGFGGDPYAPISGTRAGNEDDPQGKKRLFGEPIDLPSYSGETGREFVLRGVEESLRPQYQQARGEYSNRGFGRIHAPSVKGALYEPIMRTGAESVRRALTDIEFKERGMQIQEAAAGRAAKIHKEKMKGGKVVCTALWNRGILPFSHIKADYKYLEGLLKTKPWIHKDYLAWGVPLAKRIEESDLVAAFVSPFVRAWSGYMRAKVNNTRVPILGAMVHYAGIAFGKIYKLINGAD